MSIAELVLRKLIAGSATYYQLSPEQLARKAGMSRATWYRRMEHPLTFTLGELLKMAKAYHWDSEAIGELFEK